MEWTQERLEALFNNVEENQHLDYKDGRFLKKDCQDDLTKQIVGFANSDGGALIIGVSEGRDDFKHYATGFAPCNGIDWTKERLEAMIDSNISPRIGGIVVHPIRLDDELSKSVYVIQIPKSDTCHQASDLKYYYRLNFSTKAMHDFQIRDVMNRKRTSKLQMSVVIRRMSEISIGIQNNGAIISKNWNLNFMFPEDAIEFVPRGTQGRVDLGNSYLGVKSLQLDHGDIENVRVLEMTSKSCHVFQYSKTVSEGSQIIFPRSRLEVASFKAEYIDESRLIFYWQIDSDDGRRTYGFVTPEDNETYEFNSDIADKKAYIKI